MIPILDVITITSGIEDEDGTYKEFHFRNEERKDLFVKTLYSHRTSDVDFSVEEQSLQPTRELLMELDKDPIKYAAESVMWAKNAISRYYDNHLTEEELAYVRKLA